jgi:hypothetical protein
VLILGGGFEKDTPARWSVQKPHEAGITLVNRENYWAWPMLEDPGSIGLTDVVFPFAGFVLERAWYARCVIDLKPMSPEVRVIARRDYLRLPGDRAWQRHQFYSPA